MGIPNDTNARQYQMGGNEGIDTAEPAYFRKNVAGVVGCKLPLS